VEIISAAAIWADQQQTLICQFGRALTDEEQAIARHLGVAELERVHIYEVPVIKLCQALDQYR
jgi:hypothetical protein